MSRARQLQYLNSVLLEEMPRYREEARAFPATGAGLEPAPAPDFRRCPVPSPELRDDRVTLKALGRDGVSVNRETVDLRYVEQLADGEQSAALGYCLLYAQRHLFDGRRTLQQVVAELDRLMAEKGLDALCEGRARGALLARPRPQEIFACLNRYRGLRLA